MVKREFTEVLCCTPSERRGDREREEGGGDGETERVRERRIRAGERS
jgi:hypothetical protein